MNNRRLRLRMQNSSQQRHLAPSEGETKDLGVIFGRTIAPFLL